MKRQVMATRTQQSSGIDPPFLSGAVAGAVSYLVGYILTLVVVVVAESDQFTNDLIESAGFLYYNAQFANVETSVDGGGAFGAALEQEFNYLTDSSLSSSVDAPAILYHLIPILVLVGVGYAVARQVHATDLVEGAVAGASLVLGTVVLALLGTFLFSLGGNGGSVSPVLFDGVLLVGLVFPGVFGAVGGAISTQVGSNQQQQYGRR
jgi:hypothetical protein